MNYYVCKKYNTIWTGSVDEIRSDYSYGRYTWYFQTKEEAENFACWLFYQQEEESAEVQ